jgi:hypothetical protein
VVNKPFTGIGEFTYMEATCTKKYKKNFILKESHVFIMLFHSTIFYSLRREPVNLIQEKTQSEGQAYALLSLSQL